MASLRRAFQRDDGKKLAAFQKVHLDRELGSQLASDRRLRLSTARLSRPAGSRFAARATIRGSTIEVRFIRRTVVECGMRELWGQRSGHLSIICYPDEWLGGDVLPALQDSDALQQYLDFFQTTRDGQRMGIVEVLS